MCIFILEKGRVLRLFKAVTPHRAALHLCLLFLYESSTFNCAKGGIGNSGRNVGDTQTCSMVVSMWAATIPNSSWTAPTKSFFVCIFITGVEGSKGDKTDLKKKKHWVYAKHSSVRCATLCVSKIMAMFAHEISHLHKICL